MVGVLPGNRIAVEPVKGSAPMTAQDLLNLASQKLLEMSEPAPAITSAANAEGESPVIAPNTWVDIKGLNLAPVGFADAHFFLLNSE
jgi:hypothetical protein